jgi:hypothetical protein
MLVGAAVAGALLLLGVRRWDSPQLFLLATFLFIWPAATLFLDLHHRLGMARQIGWLGLLGAAPITVAIVILALCRHHREQAATDGEH